MTTPATQERIRLHLPMDTAGNPLKLILPDANSALGCYISDNGLSRELRSELSLLSTLTLHHGLHLSIIDQIIREGEGGVTHEAVRSALSQALIAWRNMPMGDDRESAYCYDVWRITAVKELRAFFLVTDRNDYIVPIWNEMSMSHSDLLHSSTDFRNPSYPHPMKKDVEAGLSLGEHGEKSWDRWAMATDDDMAASLAYLLPSRAQEIGLQFSVTEEQLSHFNCRSIFRSMSHGGLSRVREFFSLVQEYNLEWALASFD